MIGANNYGFADIVERCVTNWLTSPSWWKNYCSDDSDIASRFTAARQAAGDRSVKNALLNVRQAMTNAGYSASQYTIIAQTYWSPIPRGSGFRYPESGLDAPVDRRLRHLEPRRQLGQRHGRHRDEQHDAQRGHPLRHLEHRDPRPAERRSTAAGCARTPSACSRRSAWRPGQSAGAVDRTEWVSQIRTVTTIVGPYQLQEGSHANYWGQLAMRNCLRLAYNGGAVRGGRCVRVANGLTSRGEPQMGLQ